VALISTLVKRGSIYADFNGNADRPYGAVCDVSGSMDLPQMFQIPSNSIASDCRHYRGDRPCLHNRLCSGCSHYAPYQHRICIIKLGALGDVVRTLCILPELHRRYPDAHVTWVSKPNGVSMIANHPMIARTMPFDPMTCMILGQEQFDVVLCLDKEPAPCALANTINAVTRLGVGLTEFGTPEPVNIEAERYFHLGLSDDLKFLQNSKGYPQLVYEALGWTYRGQRYELPVLETAATDVAQLLTTRGRRSEQPMLGLNVGAGTVFANKMWPVSRQVQLVRRLRSSYGHVQILLLGGPSERSIIDEILRQLAASGDAEGVIDAGTDHDEQHFIALVDACDVMFSGDTMAMHVALARGKRVVVFFGPTCEQEIDLFGHGEKLIAATPCSPCYKRTCDQGDVCLESVSMSDAVQAIARALGVGEGLSLSLPVIPARRAG